jgi:hypothetical protein
VIYRDNGSIAPIGLGLITLTAAISLVFLELIGVQYQTLRDKQLSDVVAVKIATDLKNDGIAPVMNLDYRPVAQEVLKEGSTFLKVSPTQFSVTSPDGKTIESVVCSRWKSILGFTFGNFGEICARSKARAVASE